MKATTQTEVVRVDVSMNVGEARALKTQLYEAIITLGHSGGALNNLYGEILHALEMGEQ